ncbi:MAG: bifunctional adenosylcobinamide kinase/adenosylcobinamide-phosphate guanylyltransferase [Clostridia bacterium]|nr:bifunctional adenosylcobinamide kinase/adenosylcobinamide-phosphate guanylyltransferase [Clostridia bacterium]
MIFITGPMFSGKTRFAAQLLCCGETLPAGRAVTRVQELAAQCADPAALVALADRLAAYEVVVADEVGGGVVPIDPAERAAREAAGQLACLLAERAETVVRLFCGLPTVLKGVLP